MPQDLKPVMTPETCNAFLNKVFPQFNAGKPSYIITEIGPGTCSVQLLADERHLRPGNTVSGPSLFGLADITGYAACLSHIGEEALAVTTNLNINFMRKAEAGTIESRGRILKLGRQLMVFDCEMIELSTGNTVAHATGTYAIPPK